MLSIINYSQLVMKFVCAVEIKACIIIPRINIIMSFRDNNAKTILQDPYIVTTVSISVNDFT